MKAFGFKVLITILIFSFIGLNPAEARKRRSKKPRVEYIELQKLDNSDLDLFIDKRDLEQDFKTKVVELNFALNASKLIANQHFPLSIKLEIYDIQNGERRLISILRPSLFSLKQATKFKVDLELSNLRQNSNLEIKVFDANNEHYASFELDVDITNTDTNTTNFADLINSSCVDSFGDCQLKYFFENVHFATLPSNGLETKIEKNIDGSYTVNLPLHKYRKKIKVKNTISESTQTIPEQSNNQDFSFDFNGSSLFVVKNGVRTEIGGTQNQAGEQGEPGPQGPKGEQGDAGPPGSFSGFSSTVFGTLSFSETGVIRDANLNGALSINGSLAFLNDSSLVNADLNGATTVNGNLSFLNNSSLVNADLNGATTLNGNITFLNTSSLINSDLNGATTVDGSMTFLNNSSLINANLIGATTLNGSISFSNGITLIDSNLIGDSTTLNGQLSFLGAGIMEDAILNGSLTIPTGAANNYVLKSNASGVATWGTVGSVFNGAGLQAKSVGNAGAIQLTDGSNGFTADTDDLHWNSGTKRLVVNGDVFVGDGDAQDGTLTVRHSGDNIFEVNNTSDGRFRLNASGARTEYLEIFPRHSSVTRPTINSSNDLALRFDDNDIGMILMGRTVANEPYIYGSGNTPLVLRSNLSSTRAVTIRGVSSQTANLTEWQNGGSATLSVVDEAGNIGAGITNPARSLHISTAMRLEPLSGSQPTSASMGDLYSDGDTGTLCYYDGSVWVAVAGGTSTCD